MADDQNYGRSISTNRQGYIFLYIIVSILLLAGLIFLFKSSLFDKRTVNAKILKDEILLDEDLIYSDNTQNANNWLWEFGNGDKSTKQNGSYHYNKPGAYIVRLTVDGKLQQQFPVDVKEVSAAPLNADTLITVNGPTQGIVNEQVRLEAQGTARIYEWSFGETGRVDVKGPTALYTYHNPGTYFVKLNTDKGRPAYHKILITNPDSVFNTMVTPGEGEQRVIDDIRAHLQAIANGADFNTHYYYLVNKYFCGDEKVTVNLESNGDRKQTDFYSYCMRLTFGGGVYVDEAQVTLKPKSTCSSLLTVKQHSATATPGIKRSK